MCLNNEGMQANGAEGIRFSLCVLLILEDITDNETAGRGSDILGNCEVDI